MSRDPLFRLAADVDLARRKAEVLFADTRRELAMILPASALVLHVGATSIPGCLTKGDLDIVVRVERGDFAAAEAALAARFSRNEGSVRTEDFAAFEDATRSPHLGIQLTAKGGNLDVFHLFVEALRDDPALVHRYNALKQTYDGKSEAAYRTAKDAFIADVLHVGPE